MAYACVSNTGVVTGRRPTYVDLHKWPESEAEFVKMVTSGKGRDSTSSPAKGFDSISCRQMYLRSYTFSRKEEGVKDKTIKYMRLCAKNVTKLKGRVVRIDFSMLKRVNHVSCAAFFSVFHRFLSCSSKVDEAHHHERHYF
ncbi:hypothetical protein QN277_008068 [Acacia crassicarpa]|uniref:Uncharacterized protein n=1 Tax=Acacia crassicarpa TaxID=499986 RepID=A0AAE1JP04_9FABA|nr:hypothetical protein QN277_008068 [Acacia crassicarpa]